MKTRIDGKAVGPHSKLRESCGVHTVEFKTKRGKIVRFKARPGGTTKFGGECKPKAVTARQRHWRREFARVWGKVGGKAAKACKGKHGAALNSCKRNYIKAHV